ncbi:MAG TPA: DUF2332 domain-containing protein [Ktedonobacteraceae bacterium]|nr:DUF2332 domain-containing protein [Ktedonobacteraceae bacterium]
MSFHQESIPDPRHWNQAVAARFARLSPLYHQFYQGMQHDPELLALLSLVDPNQPMYVLFLSTVNLLAWRMQHRLLTEFYPYFCPHPRPASDAYPVFRQFCLEHAEALRLLLPHASLQTNEVTRCANLLPAFELISRRTGRQPLALIEVGASAGLNLHWDRYGYRYGNLLVGDQQASVQLACTLKGMHLPPFPEAMPLVAQRIGIDLAPLDPHSTLDADWLHACIWPEELHRYQVLAAALQVARQHPVTLLKGDACELLPDVLADVPEEATLCLWHSYALAQGPKVVYEQIVQHLLDASRRREIHHLSLELDPARGHEPRLELFTYREGRLASYDWLASCEVHGEAMTWHGFPTTVQPYASGASDARPTRTRRKEQRA